MQLTADPSFPCSKLGLCAVPFAADLSVQLAGGPDGIRTIYARVFDAAAGGVLSGRFLGPTFGLPSGNASQAVSDTVVLDTVGPKIVVKRTPEPQKAGKAVTFDGSSSTDTGGFNADSGVEPGTAIWDFGDGAKASGTVVSHSYAKAGKYTSSFTLKDKVGNASTFEVPVTIMPSDWGGTGTPTQTAGTPTTNPSQADVSAPVLLALKVARKGARLRLSFNLSEDASVVIGVERVRPRRMVAATARLLKAGPSAVTINARLARRTRYRVLVAARDAAGNTSPTRVVILRRLRR
jgi:chitodextrinase